MVTQIGMQGSKCGIAIYNADPKDAHLINGAIVNCSAWGMEKSGALTEQVEKHVHFRTSKDDLDSLYDDSIEFMKNLEQRKR